MLTSFTKDFLTIENYFHLYNYYFFFKLAEILENLTP